MSNLESVVKNPTVSVIMGVYNQLNNEALYKAVHSILNQSFSDFEFIIYDDGSNEEGSDYINSLKDADERLSIISCKENNGLAFSLNECLKVARGKYIARMDADDVSLPDRFQAQVDYLEAHKDVSWCGCNAYLFDEEGIYGNRSMPAHPTVDDYLKYSPYIHPTVMYRKTVLDECEGYAVEKDTLLCEDYEIFMRLKSLGFYGANLQQPYFLYRENANSFKRRGLGRRIKESKIRFRSFKRLGILFPKGIFYVMRPIIGFFVPTHAIRFIKRKEAVCVEKSITGLLTDVPKLTT